ncbi:MAG: hypothetical protein HND48_00920 [Chloroflexi bacterium]|nr:hypothetical protein [Chloroflexota bacterium]
MSRSYVSNVLTDLRREEARASTAPVYNPPDLNVARVQTSLAARILEFIDNVRRDPYATVAQKIDDFQQITALRLDEQTTAEPIAAMTDEQWALIRAETLRLLENVMQDSIRESEVTSILERLPNQVSLRFDSRDVAIIVDIVSDLIRPNRTLNAASTQAAREAAAQAVPEQISSFQRGQIVVELRHETGASGCRGARTTWPASAARSALSDCDARRHRVADGAGDVRHVFGPLA